MRKSKEEYDDILSIWPQGWIKTHLKALTIFQWNCIPILCCTYSDVCNQNFIDVSTKGAKTFFWYCKSSFACGSSRLQSHWVSAARKA